MTEPTRCTTCGHRQEYCTCHVATAPARCRVCFNVLAYCTCPTAGTGRLSYPDVVDTVVVENELPAGGG